jgi:uncharacterized protein (TIGR03083 family)
MTYCKIRQRLVFCMEPVKPISTVELFPRLSRELLAVLSSLERWDWDKPTACAQWSVKDVAAHLLGGNLGRLKDYRDGLSPGGFPFSNYAELLAMIDHENAEWVSAARRISPSLLIEFLESTDAKLYQYFKTLQPEQPSVAVAWAGETVSPAWFDIAREYTEKWLHQQHIREAVGRPLLTEREWLFPVLDTFMRALPYAYRGSHAPAGTRLTFSITGAAGGDWSLLRHAGRDAWVLMVGSESSAASRVRLDQDLAWRLFTKGVSVEYARPKVQIAGDQALGAEILHMVAIMA